MKDKRETALPLEHQLTQLSQDEMQQTLGGGTLVGNPGAVKYTDIRAPLGIFTDGFESGNTSSFESGDTLKH